MGINAKVSHQAYPVGTTAAKSGPHLAGAPTDAEPEVVPVIEQPEQPEQPELADGAPAAAPAPVDSTQPPAAPAETAPDKSAERAGPDEPLTPIPDAPTPGAAAGEPVLVGGADLLDSTATLVAYQPATTTGQPREVLLTTVREDAEDKLLAAVALSEQQMVPIQVEEEVHGRLPRDEQAELHEKVAQAARSVNHKLKTGAEIPAKSLDYYAAADAAVAAVENDTAATDAEKVMAAHYRAHLQQIRARISGEVTAGYDTGGKIPLVEPHQHHGTATVTKLMPAPLAEPPPGLLPATLRDASRIKPTIDPATGRASWNGRSRAKAGGKEYLLDLGDGYTAVYRPHEANDPAKHEFSLRGQLEVHAPAGTGHGRELVHRLAQLNLVNQPMTRDQGEWTYLEANITAQGLAGHPEVQASFAAAGGLENLEVEEIFHARAHEAIGLDEPGLHELARSFRLEAQARVLPKKVRLVREAVAHATGHASGADLASSPGYDPTPRRSGGWLTWSRFDVTSGTGAVNQAWKGRALVHQVSGHNLSAILASGVLASTERRALMGVAGGLGMSEGADKLSGGANSVFLRVRKSTGAHGPALVWDDPAPMLSRSDYYAYSSDHYGALNPASHHSTAGLTRDPVTIAGFSGGNNEIMFRNGLDLLGAEAPSRILCGSTAERQAVLEQLTSRGITELGGRPVDDVVRT